MSSDLFCGKYNFCVKTENNTPYCYGSPRQCLWNYSNNPTYASCLTDSDCNQYDNNSMKHKGVNCDNVKDNPNSWEGSTCISASSHPIPSYKKCTYKMNNNELNCYKKRYPSDLSNMTNTQLQTHWETIGCKQERVN